VGVKKGLWPKDVPPPGGPAPPSLFPGLRSRHVDKQTSYVTSRLMLEEAQTSYNANLQIHHRKLSHDMETQPTRLAEEELALEAAHDALIADLDHQIAVNKAAAKI